MLNNKLREDKRINKIKKQIDIPILTNFKNVLNYELEIDKIYSLITDNDIINKELKAPIIRK